MKSVPQSYWRNLSRRINEKTERLSLIESELSDLNEIKMIMEYLDGKSASDGEGYFYKKYGLLDRVPDPERFKKGNNIDIYSLAELPSNMIVCVEDASLIMSPVFGYECYSQDQYGSDLEQRLLVLNPKFRITEIARYKLDRVMKAAKTKPDAHFNEKIKFKLRPIEILF